MIKLEETELMIYGVENDLQEVDQLYVLMFVDATEGFDAETFITKLSGLAEKEMTDDEYEEEYNELLDSYNVIEVFQQADIEELIENGDVDSEDIHGSLFQFLGLDSE